MEVKFWNGGWMHCFQSIQMWEDILEEDYPWYMYFQLSDQLNRRSTQKAPQIWKYRVLMITCQQSVGLGISLQRNATMSKMTVCISIIKVPFLWKIMGRLQAAIGKIISILGISSRVGGNTEDSFRRSPPWCLPPPPHGHTGAPQRATPRRAHLVRTTGGSDSPSHTISLPSVLHHPIGWFGCNWGFQETPT